MTTTLLQQITLISTATVLTYLLVKRVSATPFGSSSSQWVRHTNSDGRAFYRRKGDDGSCTLAAPGGGASVVEKAEVKLHALCKAEAWFEERWVRLTGTTSAQVAKDTKDTTTFNGLTVDIHQYIPPSWASKLKVPTHQLKLGHLPTPIHRWNIPNLEQSNSTTSGEQYQNYSEYVQFYIKRDDYSGSEMSGNKVRKLEFLLADALQKKCNSVITVGGIQSNHCRATAVACARVGLKAHLVLRTSHSTTEVSLYQSLFWICSQNIYST